jgi:hypothetical protein
VVAGEAAAGVFVTYRFWDLSVVEVFKGDIPSRYPAAVLIGIDVSGRGVSEVLLAENLRQY